MNLGLDYASVDGNQRPNFVLAKQSGASFVVIRKFQHLNGYDIPDKHYARDAQAARDAGLVVGSYMFPGWGIRCTTPKAQVQAFKKASGEILPGIDFPPSLDIEPGAGGWASTGHSRPEIMAIIEQLVRELEDSFGCRPLIYTSYNQWYDLGLPKAPWIAECPLWIKTAYRLGARQAPDQVVPMTPHLGVTAQDPKSYRRIPDPWKHTGWAIQQFQGDSIGFPGFNKTVDVNRFNAMRPGDISPSIEWLRRKVVKCVLPVEREDLQNAWTPSSPTGNLAEYDDELAERVREVQRNAALDPDGIVGVRTFSAIAWR